MPGKRNGLYIVGGGTNAATGGCPVSDVDGTQTLLVADNKTIVPRARGATGNAVKSNAWDENEVLLEGEELVTLVLYGQARPVDPVAAYARAGVEIGTAYRGAVVRQDPLRRQRRGWRR